MLVVTFRHQFFWLLWEIIGLCLLCHFCITLLHCVYVQASRGFAPCITHSWMTSVITIASLCSIGQSSLLRWQGSTARAPWIVTGLDNVAVACLTAQVDARFPFDALHRTPRTDKNCVTLVTTLPAKSITICW